jgi:hypothetical protein
MTQQMAAVIPDQHPAAVDSRERLDAMTCDASIRPFPDQDITPCELPAGHDGDHLGAIRDKAYPGSVTQLGWLESDRRTFHGDWPGVCPESRCTLPAGHPRNHSVD